MTTWDKTTLYYDADRIHGALRRLGPAALRDEAIISSAVRTFADMIESGGTWEIIVDPTGPGPAIRIERVKS